MWSQRSDAVPPYLRFSTADQQRMRPLTGGEHLAVKRKPPPAEGRALFLCSPMHMLPQVGTFLGISAWISFKEKSKNRQTRHSNLPGSKPVKPFTVFPSLDNMLMFSLHQPDRRYSKPDGKVVE